MPATASKPRRKLQAVPDQPKPPEPEPKPVKGEAEAIAAEDVVDRPNGPLDDADFVQADSDGSPVPAPDIESSETTVDVPPIIEPTTPEVEGQKWASEDAVPVAEAEEVDPPHVPLRTRYEVLMDEWEELSSLATRAENDVDERNAELKLTSEWQSLADAKAVQKLAVMRRDAVGGELRAAWRYDRGLQLMSTPYIVRSSDPIKPKVELCGKCNMKTGTIPHDGGGMWCVPCVNAPALPTLFDAAATAEPDPEQEEIDAEVEGDELDDDDQYEDADTELEDSTADTITDETGYGPVIAALMNLIEEDKNTKASGEIQEAANKAKDQVALVKELAKIAKHNGYAISYRAPFATRVEVAAT